MCVRDVRVSEVSVSQRVSERESERERVRVGESE